MGEGQWRELIESYVAGRLSADSFKRRFLEAFSASRLVPQAIQDLYFTVDAYAGDPMGRGHDVADDAALMVAARRALLRLVPNPEAGPSATPPRADEPPRAAGPRGPLRAPPALAAGLGLGCLLIGALFAVGIVQLFAIAAQVNSFLRLGEVLSTLAALVLTFVPIVGSVIAFFGAKDVWNWSPWAAGLVFLVLPITAQTLSILSWRRRRLPPAV
jgi:hypothetical protein